MSTRRAKVIIDPFSKGLIPFSLSESGDVPYMCSACKQGFLYIEDAIEHTYTVHPREKKPKKFKTSKPVERLRKPDAQERKQIRQAIIEGRNQRVH